MSKQLRNPTNPSTEPAKTMTISAGDFTIRKAISPYQDDVVKVGFTIDSVADEPVHLRLADQLPEEVEMDSVGFHPEYDPDGWTVGDGQTVIYETVVGPGDSRETVYGARVASAAELEPFAIEPSLAIDTDMEGHAPSNGSDDGLVFADDSPDAEPSASEGDSTVAEGDESAETDGAPTSFDPDAEAADDLATNGDGSRSIGSSGTVGTDDAPASESDEDAGIAGSPEPPESVIDEFLGELRRRELTADERDLLHEELALEPAASEAVRLDHVQATVDDLVAYRDALEGFIDEQGPAETILDELRSSIADHTEAISRLEASVDDLRGRLGTLEETQADDSEAIQDRVSSVEAELSAELLALDDDVETMHAELQRLQEWREKLSVAAQLADTGVKSDSQAD